MNDLLRLLGRLAPLLAVAAMTSGCGHRRHSLQRQAAGDFNCSARQLRVTPYGDRSTGQFIVQGCGRRAVYAKTPDGPVLASAIDADTAGGTSMSGPMQAVPPGPPGPPPPPPPPLPDGEY